MKRLTISHNNTKYEFWFFTLFSSSKFSFPGDWKFGHHVCQFWLTMDYTASTASIFNLSILSLDRYWSITSPLRYLRKRTKKRALVMITMAWIGASMWFIPVLGWNQILRKGKSQLPGEMHYVWFSQVWSHFCGTNALFASKAKINVVWNFFEWRVPEGYPECRKNFKQRWF